MEETSSGVILSRDRGGRQENKPAALQNPGATQVALTCTENGAQFQITSRIIIHLRTLERSAEKAGVGGSTPSLATMFSMS
jgi:hypothetical protein